MAFHMRKFNIVCLLGFFVLLAGCSGSDSVDSAPTQTTDSPPLSAQPFEVTFDGTTCPTVGPAELPPGEHSYILYNTSEMNVKLEVARFDQGNTMQDLLDIQEEPGDWWPKPKWLTHSSSKGKPWSTDDGGKAWTYKTYIPAEYVIYVIIFDYDNDPTENKLWFCEQFSIKSSPSE